MRKVITVCILDENRFFVQGVQQILLTYFKVEGVRFVGESEEARADLVFWSIRKGGPLQLCCHRKAEKPTTSGYITVSNKLRSTPSRCLREEGHIWRQARPQALLLLVEQCLQSRDNLVRPVHCPYCRVLVLTVREQEVMRCIGWEMTMKNVANYLSISQKTVSAHKRAAMRKLGFHRNSELYHWLLLGGLDQIKRPYP